MTERPPTNAPRDALRVIDSGILPARRQIAATAALVEFHRSGLAPDTLRFHRYPRSVLLGHTRSHTDDVDAERCRASGIEIARRMTGGGTIYMSPSILAWDIVMRRSRFAAGLEEAAAEIGSAVAAALVRLGAAARFRAPGDVLIDGRKVSGSGGAFEGGSLLFQGTVLVDVDMGELRAVLKQAPASAPALVTLAEALGVTPPLPQVQAAISEVLVDALGVVLRDGVMDDAERALADRLHNEEYGSDLFVAGVADDAAASPRQRALP